MTHEISGGNKHDSKWMLVTLGILSIVTFGICFVLFVVNSVQYLHEPEATGFLVFLFGLPPLAQLAGLFFLYVRVRVDRSVLVFYWFYLLTMCFSLMSYVGLWGKSLEDEKYSYWALGAVGVLLLPVGLMTYAIMWVPGGDDGSSMVDQDDIEDYVKLCKQIENEGGAAPSRPGQIVMELLTKVSESAGEMVITASSIGRFREEDKELFVRALNAILMRPDFYRSSHFEAVQGADEAKEYYRKRMGKRKRSGAIRRANRRLLDAAYPGLIVPTGKPRPLRVLFERFVENLKSGAGSVPFWALVFFFTVFLCVTYLFAFAFAFHDRKTAQTKGMPALYMTKPYLANTGKQEQAIATASIEDSKATGLGHEYRFYFDSPTAFPKYKKSDFNETAYLKSQGPQRSRDWGERKNFENSTQLVETVIEASKNGSGVRIRLIGRADDGALKPGGPYASNYELSEARAQVLRGIILEKLGALNKKDIHIEWSILPLSSESTSLPWTPSQQDTLVGQDSKQQADDAREACDALMQKLVQDEVLDDVKKGHLKFRLALAKAKNTPPVTQLRVIDRINELIKTEKLAKDQLSQLAILDADTKTQDEEKQAKRENLKRLNEQTQQAINFRDEEIQEALYVEDEARKRVVSAIVEPLQERHRFYSLTLMDYTYFTIYTITTTGYGDIVPTTTYAKFLCSSANILEVFFLVVFFNALLSVKSNEKYYR
jgi:hypothetical protein